MTKNPIAYPQFEPSIENKKGVVEMVIESLNSKYNTGDKVVIKKYIQIGESIDASNRLGEWSENMEYLKEKDYVVIEYVDNDGDYLIDGEWYITDYQIDGHYVEKYEEKESYQVGDRVVLDKELLKKNWTSTDEERDLLLAVDYITITNTSYQNAIFCKEIEMFIENKFIKGLYIDTISKFHIKMSGNDKDVLHINDYEKCKFKPIDESSEYYQTEFEKWEAITLINKSPFLFRDLLPKE